MSIRLGPYDCTDGMSAMCMSCISMPIQLSDVQYSYGHIVEENFASVC